MKIPLSWISMYTDISKTLTDNGAKSLAHLYSIHTAEIDAIEEVGQEDRVLVAKVLATRPHPDSDHLNLVELNLGKEGKRNIVCGADNVREAKYVVVAIVGARLGPDRDFEIKLSKIRGEVSEGMICSLDELGLQEERAAGIMQLESYFDETILEKSLGTPFYDLRITIPGNGQDAYSFPIRDIVFEIDNKFITNRPDLFSVIGNAREFGAIFNLPFHPYIGDRSRQRPVSELVVDIESPKVLSYNLLSFRNIPVGSSPFGIDQMLRKSGISPKYDLVDITNYIMTELGQPMHAFDTDKINGHVIVRQARDGETILALDGREYTLTHKDLVIADSEKPIAIAGIIGGMDSAVSEATRNVSFESACFDPVSVRLTAQRLGIRTDASMRYEKSLDPLLAERALPRIFDLLKFLGKPGEFVGESHYLNEGKIHTCEIRTDIDFVEKKIGLFIPKVDIENILHRLGFEVSWAGNEFSVVVPSWRATKDISIKEDLVEEIGRIYGYDRVPDTPVLGPFSIADKNREISLRDQVNAYFSACGLFEVYNYSFSNKEKDARIGLEDDENAIHIRNAFNVEHTLMRRSLAPALLNAVRENLKQQESFGLFEIGKIFERLEDNEFNERKNIAGVLVGQDMMKLREMLDGFVRSTLPGMDAEVTQGTQNIAHLHPNKSGTYRVNADTLITFGSVHPAVAESFGLSSKTVLFFEIDHSLLMNRFAVSNHTFQEIPKYPGIRRELNFVINERVPVGDVVSEIASVHTLLSDFQVVDIFRDATKVGPDKKSVTFSFLIQDPTKTITDEEALVIQQAIIAELEKKGRILRK